MNKPKFKSIGVIFFGGMPFSTNALLGQRTEAITTTITTSEGTVSEFSPRSIIVRSAPGTQPVHYISDETTNYVDEDGNPVGVTTVKSGLPVTVYYSRVGDSLIASKVMVRKAAVVPTRTTEATQSMITSAGTISEFGSGRIIIKSESSPDPLRYTYGKTTTYVDENGRSVSIETVKSGLPVTVYYTKVGNTLVASKVLVRKVVAAQAPLIEETKIRTKTTTETRK